MFDATAVGLQPHIGNGKHDVVLGYAPAESVDCLLRKRQFRLLKDGTYYEFDNWEESVKAYRDYVQYKYKGADYYQFLQRIGYAEDPNYVTKVRQIARTL